MDNQIEKQYQENIPFLNKLEKNLEEITNEVLEGVQHIDRIYFRVKTLKSFIDKANDPNLKTPYKYPLNEIEDQVAGRIIVFFLDDLEIVKDLIFNEFTKVEFDERRTKPDENFGYESDHYIFTVPPHAKPDNWDNFDSLPNTFELQVRTIFMHAYAEPQHNIGYKPSIELLPDRKKELAWIAASAWGADHALSRIYNWYKENQSN